VPFAFKGKLTTWARSEITGAPVAHYSEAPWDTIVPLYRETVAGVTVRQPAGYVVPQEWTRAIDLLRLHAVRIRRLARAWSDSVEMTRIAEWTADAAPFEGHRTLHVGRVGVERQWRTFRPGDVW